MSYCKNADTFEKNDIPKTNKAQIAVLTPSVDKDFLYIPAGVNHYYEACYGSDYEFLCMITTKEDEITML